MAKQQTTLVSSNASDASFREWAQFIHDAFSLAGFVIESTVTGQINLSTVTRPLTNGAIQGFEVWKTDDGLATWYIKVEYGGYGTNVHPAVWVTAGTSFNTSGTILGNQAQVRMGNGSAAAVPTARSACYASGREDVDEGVSVSIAMFCDGSANFGSVLNIERAHTQDGDIDPDNIILVVGGPASADAQIAVIPRVGGVPPVVTSGVIHGPQLISNYYYNNTVGAILWFGQKGGLVTVANLVGVNTTAYVESSAGGTIKGTLFGIERTYLFLTQRPFFGRSGDRILMRFD